MIEVEEMKNLYRDEFETVFGVKKNIQALRDKVLDLAIQGKLVEQDPDDEPASRLTERIKIEKQELISSKQIRKIKTIGEITDNEIPYDIPSNWEWERLNEVLDVRDGTHDTPKYVEKGIPLITSKNLKNGEIDYSNIKYISKKDHEEISKRSRVDDSDILLAMIGSIGNAVLVKKDREFSIKNMALFKNYPNESMNMQYMKYFFDAVENKLKGDAGGGVQTFLSLTYFRNLLVPIPPMSEQKRIVVRLNELLTAIDKLDEQLEEKEKLETLIPKAVVTALSNSQDEEELKKNLALVIKNFADVFQTPESLEEFRNVVLRLAYQGKLMSQKQQDEPIEALIEKFQNKNKLKVIPKEDEPFEVPNTWRWIKLKQIGTIVGGGTPKTNVREYWDDGEIPWISPADLSKYKDKYISHGRKSITEEGLSKSSAKLLPTGSVMMSSRAPIGYVAIASNPIATNQGFKSVVPFVLEMNEYIYYYFFAFIEDIKSRSSGTTFKEISGKELGNSLFPLPPLEEQKRIVAKIESIFAVIDQLEEEMKRRDRIVEAMAVI